MPYWEIAVKLMSILRVLLIIREGIVSFMMENVN